MLEARESARGKRGQVSMWTLGCTRWAGAPGCALGARPPLLLQALVALGGQNVPEHRLSTALWPDAEGHRARQALDTALHRLRKALGDSKLVVLRHGLLSLDAKRCWVDLFEFEDPRPGESSARLPLYGGLFLPELEHPWVIGTRARAQRRFWRMVEAEASTHERHGRFEAALECYENALEIDDLHEPFYQGSMRCLQALRRPTEARRLLMRCDERLRAELDAGPSSQTQRLAVAWSR